MDAFFLCKTGFIFIFFKDFIYLLCIESLPPCMPAGQRAPDLITDGCEPPCGCWELNSGPLEEQSVLLTAEPSLQPCKVLLLDKILDL